MKKPVNSVFFRVTAGLLMLVGFVISAQAQTTPHVHTDRCATPAVEQLLRLRNPARQKQAEALERLIQQQQLTSKARQADDNTVYRIPVVVHVIHNNSSNFVGGTNNPNISDEQIQSQIRVLNEDYRRQAGTNGFNTSPIGSDTGVEFYLATTDPQGQPSKGITRTYYDKQTEFDAFSYSDLVKLSNIVYWPSDRYLNIWVTRLSGLTLGYAQMPMAADTLQGLPTGADVPDEKIDGVVISYVVFGANACNAQYRSYCQGRTTTHEVGHWLGLLHTNGDVSCGTDHVADTPPVEQLNRGTTCTSMFSECVRGQRTRNLTENYMDYSPDACMNMFTLGQRARMRAVLAVSPRRQKLIQSVNNPLGESDQLSIAMVPNPAQFEATAEVRFRGAKSLTVELLDLNGRLIQTRNYSTTTSTRVSLTVTNLPKGMYIVRATAGDETTATRLLVH
ncbi:M43 family zinc metalloprotease [Rudanella lutea]|uniref:M43 family zinc metalloprotease n=1 Tax=Rudanella lutea TaxID=451374 RepID=UPI000371D094|nr:M43 family zinc metalloprotease [Rudanella lutea]